MTWEELKYKYEIGKIYNLQVVNILTVPQLVLFNIEGYDCRLHVSNIANEKELSNSLFSVINIGDIISVVITDFYDDKQNINLSTKVFRTYLDDILPFNICKRIIKENLNSHLTLPPKFLRQNRNILDRLRGDLSSNELTFLYELIQNAVDHPNKNFNNVSITFEVFNNYLLVKHNGALFTENNFESITGILGGEQINETEKERIGYKGIGFKSVFDYSHNVYIRSGNFSFCFNKELSGDNMPWEVLPIFQLEKDKIDQIPQFEFFNVPVAFAFELVNNELKSNVIKYLKQLSQNPYLLIFLEDLIKLEIKIPGEEFCIQKSIEKFNNYNVLTIKSNESDYSKWITYSKTFEIREQEVIDELLDENIKAVPSKMRHFRNPKVSIAYPIDNKEDLINFFTYLPLSNTKYNLPYIINADFIPDLGRTDIVNNLKYNTQVLKFVSDTLLSFTQLLISEGMYSYFIDMIPDFYGSKVKTLNTITDYYDDNFSILELPNNKNTLVQKDQIVIDNTGIFSIVDESFITEIEKFKDKFILSSNLNDEKGKISKNLKVDSFEEKDLLELMNIQSFKEQYLSDYKNLIFFLFKIRHIKSSKTSYSTLKTKVKPYKENNEYYHLSEITLNIEEIYKDTFKYLELYIPASKELEEAVSKYPKIKSLVDNLAIKEYKANITIDLIATNIKEIAIKLSINKEDSSDDIINKKNILNNIWFYLFSNKDLLDKWGYKLVGKQFSELLIECVNGISFPLKDTLLMKADKFREDYSFLYERYGDKEINYINIDSICIEYNIHQKDFVNFIKQIADVEVTENKLFSKTLSDLSKNDFKDIYDSNEDDVINSLISVFNYLSKIEDLDIKKNKINTFPILCSNNEIDKPLNLYFDKSYSLHNKNIDFYAEDLFKNIIDIKFISSKYLLKIDENNLTNFYKFLIKLKVTPGIKKWHLNIDKKFIEIELPKIKQNYIVKDDFYFVHNFSTLSNRYENLVIFWNKLKNFEDKNLLFKKVINGKLNPKTVESPTVIYLNDIKLNFFPLKNGRTVNINEVYSSDLNIYLKNNENDLTFNINNYQELKDCLNFRKQLDNADLINALISNQEYENKDYQKLITDHFNNTDFNQEQNESINNTIKFKCFDDNFRKISETIYLDKSLESLPISLISKSNDLYKMSIDTLDYNDEFKNKLTELGITVIEDINLKINHTKEETESDTKIKEIQNIVNEYFNDKIIAHDISEIEYFFNTYDFVQCSNIELSFDNYPTFSEPVLFYNDQNNKQLFYTDELTLLDVLCEEFGINNAHKIIIRKKLNNLKLSKFQENENVVKENNENEYNNSNEFSSTEIETLKKIIGGELTEELTSQKEANFSSSLKGLLELDKIGFSPKTPEEFRETNVKTFKNNLGTERKIIFRSAVKGLLYLDPYSWKLLDTDNIEVWIYTGFNNFKTIHSKMDLLNMPYNPYTLIRVDNKNKDIELVNNLMENAPVDSTKLLFITNQEMAEKLNIDIFNNGNNPITISSNVNVENYLPE